ncbi:hypothetical protein TIFTF001_032919 [Ficus carica]|uniref:Uncharacterized protein n=1 Tax=Ficus carica TaxID=3494 RepID=A0AA88DY45_FICCA|nr:hypothetical protein TIFTF001_032919 [Ficus carica]
MQLFHCHVSPSTRLRHTGPSYPPPPPTHTRLALIAFSLGEFCPRAPIVASSILRMDPPVQQLSTQRMPAVREGLRVPSAVLLPPFYALDVVRVGHCCWLLIFSPPLCA